MSDIGWCNHLTVVNGVCSFCAEELGEPFQHWKARAERAEADYKARVEKENAFLRVAVERAEKAEGEATTLGALFRESERDLARAVEERERVANAQADLRARLGEIDPEVLHQQLNKAVEERDAALEHLRAALDAFAGGTFKEQQDVFIRIERFLGVGRG